ncbi:MAG: hypothetical protein GXO50_08580 [Chlorobi bacterium]|nr:hypothetical protein [Chlorobiota bacterium]
MNFLRFSVIVSFLFFSLISCVDEPARQLTEKEIISEIAREWNCSEDEEGFALEFTATVSADPDNDSRIYIYNFHAMGSDSKLYAVVNPDLTLDIPEQTENNQVFRGKGIVSDDYTEITWDYTITDEDDNVTSVTGIYSLGG